MSLIMVSFALVYSMVYSHDSLGWGYCYCCCYWLPHYKLGRCFVSFPSTVLGYFPSILSSHHCFLTPNLSLHSILAWPTDPSIGNSCEQLLLRWRSTTKGKVIWTGSPVVERSPRLEGIRYWTGLGKRPSFLHLAIVPRTFSRWFGLRIWRLGLETGDLWVEVGEECPLEEGLSGIISSTFPSSSDGSLSKSGTT